MYKCTSTYLEWNCLIGRVYCVDCLVFDALCVLYVYLKLESFKRFGLININIVIKKRE